MENVKFRIVKKEKDGVLLSAGKGKQTSKMDWEFFNKNYTVKDNVWAIPTKEHQDKMETALKYAQEASTAFVLAGGLKDEMGTDINSLAHMAVLGDYVTKIQDILECSILEAMQIVKVFIDQIKNIGKNTNVTKPFHHKKVNISSEKKNFTPRKKPEPKPEPENKGNQILSDNPALLKLKKQMEGGK